MSEDSRQELNNSERSRRDMIVPHGHSDLDCCEFPEVMRAPGPFVEQSSQHLPEFGGVTAVGLLRRKWMMLAVFVLVAGSAIPLIWKSVQPEFSSTATIRVAPLAPRVLYKTESNSMIPLYQNYLNTQVSIIRNPSVLQRVLDQKEIQETSWYKEKPFALLGNPPTHMERLAEDLVVRPRQNTELIDVTMTTKMPKEAKRIVDAVVQQYRESSDGILRETELQRFETLRNELRSAQNEINGLIDERFNIADRLGSSLPEELRAQLTAQLNTMRSELTRLWIDQNIREFQIEMLSAPAEEGAASENVDSSDEGEGRVAPVTARYVQDPTWSRRAEGLEEARHRLKLARQRYGEEHPTIQRLIADASHAENLLQARERELDENPDDGPAQAAPSDESPGARNLAALRYAHQVEEQRARELEKAISKLATEVGETGTLARELARNEEQLAATRTLRDEVHGRLQALEMESKAPGRISIASEGLMTTQPSRDRRPILSGLALFGAFMAAIGVGYLRSSTDSTIYEVGDIANVSRSPFLGRLPRIEGELDLSQDTAIDVALEESIRMVRTTLLRRVAGAGGPVVAITSPGPNAGKTTLAILMAKSLRQLGKKVLLVDADLRQASLTRVLGAEDYGGLVQLLTGKASHEDVVMCPDGGKFHLLPVGQRHAYKDPELLANGVMSAHVARWKKAYDFVILDGPPVLSTADGRILAGQADGAIMVLRSSHCSRTDAVEAYAGLSAAGATLLGTVLTGTRHRSSYYAYDYYMGDRETPDEVAS